MSIKMEFVPGGLLLQQSDDGFYLVTVHGQENLRTRSRSKALKKFNNVRQEMEQAFPARELTVEEKEKTMHTAIGDSLVGHNSLGGRKKKTSAGSTRTFGG